MAKIVLYSDGTGNSSSNPHKTNVWRAYQALDRSSASGQKAFYDNGVGTSSFTPTALLGLAFGWGLARNVRQIYGYLCRTYNPGDEIYGFGFSRGAFTMRVVVALICSQGIVDRNLAEDDSDLDRLIVAAYRRYRQDCVTPSLLSRPLRAVRDWVLNAWHRARGRTLYDPVWNVRHDDPPEAPPLVTFVGVWDTVDAYGLPVDELTRAWDKIVWPLTAKDRDLSPRVGRACQALALDEQRESFEPMLWNEKRGVETRVTQVWFPGVHSDVGGGYPDDSLALTALNWMLDEAEKNGGLTHLPEERRRFAEQANANGPLHDSRSGVGNFYRYAPRHIERLCDEKRPGFQNWLKRLLGMGGATENDVDVVEPKFHHSVFDRLAQGGDAYAPINVPLDYTLLDSAGTLVNLRNPGAYAGPLPETKQQAEDRRRRQSAVWVKVWARKLLYFVTLACVIAFVAYPYAADPTGGADGSWIGRNLEPYLGTFSHVIRGIPDVIGKIPGLGFAEGWATRYASFPFVFCLGLLAIVLLLVASWRVNASLKAEMRSNWRHVHRCKGGTPSTAGGFLGGLAAFLEGRSYRYLIEKPIRIGLETIAVLLFLLLLVALASRLFYVIADGFGGVCSSDAPLRDFSTPQTFVFEQKDPCFATELKLIEGNEYLIELEVSEWRDEGIEADVYGWLETPAKMYAATILRRHLFADWYQPIARIDHKLFDRYPLRETEDETKIDSRPQSSLSMRLRARRTGRLYLYLNDAVFFMPGLVKWIYKNNNGHATVRVTKLTQAEPGTPVETLEETD